MVEACCLVLISSLFLSQHDGENTAVVFRHLLSSSDNKQRPNIYEFNIHLHLLMIILCVLMLSGKAN